jgi:hypothetical protein
MNFKELTEHIVVKEALLKRRDSLHDYTAYLKESGWEYIGSGAYGVVFSKPSKNYVLKVYRDKGYDSFLQFLEKEANNPHLVKIKRKIISSNSEDFLGVVALEKLKPIEETKYRWISRLTAEFGQTLSTSSIHTSFENALQSFRDTYINENEIGRQNLKTRLNLHPRLNEYARKEYGIKRRSLDRLDFFIENYLPIAKTLYNLMLYVRRNNLGMYFDIHLGNFMIRPSTNEIVITDPLV